MKKINSRQKPPLLIEILTPLLLLVLASGILLLCAIRPYELCKTYLRVAFMDSTGSSSAGGTAGLHITETDINTNYSGETSDTGQALVPAYGAQCAILEAEAIDLYVPVYWGSGTELLEKGAVQSPSSPPLGDAGNSVVSAHVNTFFHDLMDLSLGDTVIAYTTYGKFSYKVTEIISFDSTDKSHLGATDDNRLTLYTCEMQLLGSSETRVGVVCTLCESQFYVDTNSESSTEEAGA